MSHWKNYLKERKNEEVIETESGFITYTFFPAAGECYVVDLYVRPDMRREGVATELADQVTSIAKSKGYKVLTSTVCPAAQGAHESLLGLISYGMKLLKSDNDLVWLFKEL